MSDFVHKGCGGEVLIRKTEFVFYETKSLDSVYEPLIAEGNETSREVDEVEYYCDECCQVILSEEAIQPGDDLSIGDCATILRRKLRNELTLIQALLPDRIAAVKRTLEALESLGNFY